MRRMAGWFLLVLLSGGCDSPVGVAERAAHWWDAADFADTTLTVHPEALEERFAEYVRLLEDERMDPAVAGALLCTVLGRAEANEEVFSLLGELCEKYLYSPDSPCRDEELYRHALLAVVESDRLDDYCKLRPRYQLNMIGRNRVGEPATDLTYMLPDGRQSSLYAVGAEFTLLCFVDPGCPECGEVRRELARRRLVNRLVGQGRLRVMALYSSPEEDEAAWRASLGEYPEGWIAAYDAGAQVHYRGLYDLRRVPCLYLLDARKRVLCKGAVTVEQIAGALEKALSR